MSQSGASVSQEAITTFNKVAQGDNAHDKLWYAVLKLSDDYKEIVVETSSANQDFDEFVEHLRNAQSKSKSGVVGPGPRYGFYDVTYKVEGGGKRNRMTFIAYSPDSASVQPKMIYASSKDALRRTFDKIQAEVQINDIGDLTWDNLVTIVSKGVFEK